MKNPTHIFKTVLVGFACLALLQFAPKVFGVVPPPDGGYPNFTTAEGQNALKTLTTGAGNTAIGWHSLFSASTAGFNTAIGAGTLALNTANSNTATGAAALLSNTIGDGNTANGAFALLSNNVGADNSAFGELALESNTAGTFNTALGQGALAANTLGNNNTASGAGALFLNFIGVNNTATGYQALNDNSGGSQNTAVGSEALLHSTGNLNVALGYNAGFNVTSANNVISIGSLGENISNTCWIQNIFGVTTQSAMVAPVLVSNDGQLGTLTSSRRFKHDIKPMDKASDAILALKPVTFHYNNDKTNTPQFGLVAEDVAEVNPDLVVRDKKGDINTVRYDAVNAMLLNEFLKEHHKVAEQSDKLENQSHKVREQESTITELRSIVAQQQKGMEVLMAQVKEQAAQLRRVSDRIELSRPEPRVVKAP